MWRAVGILVAGLGAISCRSLLDTDVDYEGAGGSPSGTSGTATASTGEAPSAAGPTGVTSSGTGGGASGSASSTSAGGGSSVSSSSGTGGGSGGAPACPTSDDFDTGDFLPGCWAHLNEDDAATAFVNNELRLTPEAGTGWFETSEGVFHHQEVTGDFTASVYVRAEVSGGTFQLAGLLLRNAPETAEPQDENWIKWEVGTAQGASTTYVGTTVEGATDIPKWPDEGDAAVWLGACRRGDAVQLAVRFEDSDPWEVLHDLRPGGGVPDLDGTIQLGLNAAATDGAFLVASFDDFRITLGGGDCVDVLTESHL